MTDLFRKVDKDNEKRSSPYRKFGFSVNPFPSKTSINIGDPDPRNNGSIYVSDLRTMENEYFSNIVIPSSKNQDPKVISFLMDYATRKGRGIGKTAFLNYQRQQIQADLGKRLSDGLEVMTAVYVSPRPDENYKRFYTVSKLILESMIDQELLAMAVTRIMAFTGLIDQKVLERSGGEASDIIATVGDQEWLIRTHKELEIEFDYHALIQNVKSELYNAGVTGDIVNFISRFGTSVDDFKKLFFLKQKDVFWKNYGNQILYSDFVKIFRLAGFTKCIILFDELEKIIPKQNTSERRSFCDVMRYYYIDGDCENSRISFYHMLMVIHPYLQELLVPHWEASGLQRFAALGGELAHDYTVFFESFDEQTAIPLAKAYLDASRLENSNCKDLQPFTKEALVEALRRTLGVPGKYLNFLHSAVRKALDMGWEVIDVNEINKVEMPVVAKDHNDDEDKPLPGTKSTI